MRWFKVLPLLALTVLALAVALPRQTQPGGSGGVEGLVRDQVGMPIMQAKVQVCDVMYGGCVSTASQPNGFYRIAGIASGRYSLWAEASRHASVYMPLIIVEQGHMTRQDIELSREIPTSVFDPTTIE